MSKKRKVEPTPAATVPQERRVIEHPPRDAPRAVDLAEPGAVERWARYFGVPPQELEAAIRVVGLNVTALEIYLAAPAPDGPAPGPALGGKAA